MSTTVNRQQVDDTSAVDQPARRTRRLRLGVFAVVAALLGGIGLGWAGQVLLAPPEALPAAPTYALIEASEGSVGRAINLNAQAAWAGGTEVTNQASGTVTRVHVTEPRQIKPGDVLFDVDLVPVVVAEGAVPGFRDLARGVEGADVRQFQEFLRTTGFRSSEPTGKFDATTERQARRWQKSVGATVDGTIERGSVLFVPELPATGYVPIEVKVGSPAPVGGPALRMLPPSPSFSITLPENQATMVQPGMTVRLDYGDQQWPAVIESVAPPGPEGSAVAKLGPADNTSSICADACSAVPIAGDAAIPATIQILPETTGVTVPTQALIVGTDGGAAVKLDNGEVVPVVVKASSGGIAVVDGLTAGQQVRVPAEAES